MRIALVLALVLTVVAVWALPGEHVARESLGRDGVVIGPRALSVRGRSVGRKQTDGDALVPDDPYGKMLRSRSVFVLDPVNDSGQTREQSSGRPTVDGDQALVLLTPAWVSPAAQFRARRQMFSIRRTGPHSKWTVERVLEVVTKSAGLRWQRRGGDIRVLARDEDWEVPVARHYPVSEFGYVLPVRLVHHWPGATLRADGEDVVLRTLPSLHAEIRLKLTRLKDMERQEVSFRFRWGERKVEPAGAAVVKQELRKKWRDALQDAVQRTEAHR